MINIIIVEDHIMLRDMIEESLTNTNEFKILGHSNDAKDSIELCKKYKPDILIMDVCTANNSSGII